MIQDESPLLEITSRDTPQKMATVHWDFTTGKQGTLETVTVYFAGGKTEAQRLSNFSKVTQLISGQAGTGGIQV